MSEISIKTTWGSIRYWFCMIVFFLGFFSSNIRAQVTPQGFPYQGVAFDQDGDVLADAQLFLKVLLTSGHDPIDALFTEVHQVHTSRKGRYNIVIGQGYDQENMLSDVPWEASEIWLHTSWVDQSGNPFRWESSTHLYAVPYALFAEQAGSLTRAVDATLRTTPGPSIYWLTSGNYGTVPPIHFIGNRDNENLVFKTNNTQRAIINTSGQMKITSALSGDERLESSYPLVVKGKDHGMWIKITSQGTRANNFLTFTDNTDRIHGRIEAQVRSEWEDDWLTKLEKRQHAFQIASFIARTAALVGQLGIAATPSAASVGGIAAKIAEWGLVLAGMIVDQDFFTSDALRTMGVTYQSGGADYGEWLPKADSFIHRPGLLVGEYNGAVSLQTDKANSCKVLTSRSAVLGNMPQSGQGTTYVPVALLGQVPVQIVGPVKAGDFIVPSGNNDGLGIAVRPQSLPLKDYPKIVGISWEHSNHQLIHTVNVAVGLQGNALALKMDSLNQKLDVVLSYLLKGDRSTPLNYQEEKAQLDAGKTSEYTQWIQQKGGNPEAFTWFIENHGVHLEDYMAVVHQLMIQQGIEPKETERLHEFLINPIDVLKSMRNDPSFESAWPYFDAYISKK